ncbi:hypothetical protein [Actibacterium ureilyticum]|uniref:hypothetical protein n=1 Tax=Actibacterium ureilyticum TaxID=1590614 RepID=UPI000BAB1964|nr:hypothetical protein [Actibacterium ureilyticum]
MLQSCEGAIHDFAAFQIKPGIRHLLLYRLMRQFPRDPDGTFALAYVQEWLNWENTLPVSRTLPLRPGRFAQTPLYEVLTTPQSRGAGQLWPQDMNLAMRAGRGRRYCATKLTARPCTRVFCLFVNNMPNPRAAGVQIRSG